MARIRGGITGRPSGTVANIVFGAARTREGKVVTARERVTPSNPQTTEQTQQRNAFRAALDTVKTWGPDFYQEDWNRAVGQLPGFQSVMSLLLGNVNRVTQEFGVPPDVPLGDLAGPTVPVVIDEGGGIITLSWSAGTPPGATENDEVVFFGRERLYDSVDTFIPTPERAPRSDTSVSLPAAPVGEPLLVGWYVVGKGAAEGKLSTAQFATITPA